MFNLSRLFIFILLFGLAIDSKSSELNTWVLGHVQNGDELLCQFQLDNDYFFVIKNNKSLKTGLKIDITGQNGKSKSITVGWRFKSQFGQYIGLSTSPEVEIQRVFYRESQAYFEEISIFDVGFFPSGNVDVEIGIKKYGLSIDVPTLDDFDKESIENFIICEDLMIR